MSQRPLACTPRPAWVTAGDRLALLIRPARRRQCRCDRFKTRRGKMRLQRGHPHHSRDQNTVHPQSCQLRPSPRCRTLCRNRGAVISAVVQTTHPPQPYPIGPTQSHREALCVDPRQCPSRISRACGASASNYEVPRSCPRRRHSRLTISPSHAPSPPTHLINHLSLGTQSTISRK